MSACRVSLLGASFRESVCDEISGRSCHGECRRQSAPPSRGAQPIAEGLGKIGPESITERSREHEQQEA
jgi:hypothetical protein